MAVHEDILKLLEKWPFWRRMTEAPDKIIDLETRIRELEQKLGDTWPPDVCKYCGKRAARLYFKTQVNEKGFVTEEWKCSECENVEMRAIKVK